MGLEPACSIQDGGAALLGSPEDRRSGEQEGPRECMLHYSLLLSAPAALETDLFHDP